VAFDGSGSREVGAFALSGLSSVNIWDQAFLDGSISILFIHLSPDARTLANFRDRNVNEIQSAVLNH
jgi:hypothetical protein